MFVSSGSCCEGLNSTYHVRVGRSTDPLGPYYDDQGRDMCGENRGAVVLQASADFVGVGHNRSFRTTRETGISSITDSIPINPVRTAIPTADRC